MRSREQTWPKAERKKVAEAKPVKKKVTLAESGKENLEHGFKTIFHLSKDKKYKGNADMVLLVWNDSQIVSAEQYGKANYPDKQVDIVICEDPNVQKGQLKDKAIIYDFGGNQSGSGGVGR